MKESACYLLCASPRSGSSYLSRLLEATGRMGMLGRPIVGSEYLLDLTEQTAEIDWRGFDLQAYLLDCFASSRTGNGVGGFKVMWREVERACSSMGREPAHFADLVPAATRYVLLSRDDRTAQAISLAKATQTECWNADEERAFRGPSVFDHRSVEAAQRVIASEQAGWDTFFAVNAIEPLRVRYEDLVLDPGRVVEEVARFVGVCGVEALAAGLEPEQLRAGRQRDDVTGEWRRRYEAIRAAGLHERMWFRLASYPRSLFVALLRGVRSRRRRRERRHRRDQPTSGCAVPAASGMATPK